uniref:Uncharacterized protein n=1 Tax=Oryza rufipogon TaxID=4529 RepID=A0A0E0Q642_ORYRU
MGVDCRGLVDRHAWIWRVLVFGTWCYRAAAAEIGFASSTVSSISAHLRYKHRLGFHFVVMPRASST